MCIDIIISSKVNQKANKDRNEEKTDLTYLSVNCVS